MNNALFIHKVSKLPRPYIHGRRMIFRTNTNDFLKIITHLIQECRLVDFWGTDWIFKYYLHGCMSQTGTCLKSNVFIVFATSLYEALLYFKEVWITGCNKLNSCNSDAGNKIWKHVLRMKMVVFEVVASRSLVQLHRLFRGAYCLQHQGNNFIALMMEAAITEFQNIQHLKRTKWNARNSNTLKLPYKGRQCSFMCPPISHLNNWKKFN
jgi:hypothetical protein